MYGRLVSVAQVRVGWLLLMLWLLLCSAVLGQSVDQRPNDAGKYFLSVWTSPNWKESPGESFLVQWFDSDPKLRDLKKKTHWHHYPADALMIQRYSAFISAADLPCVTLQRPDGGVIYKASRDNIPGSADALYAAMKAAHSIDPGPAESVQSPDCPDGQCDPSYAMPWNPESSVPDGNLFGVPRTPVRNTVAGVAWIIGGVFVFFLIIMFCLLTLAVIYMLTKWRV